MSETRINRDEIKGIARERREERADAADFNNEGGAGCKDCDGNACEWHDEHQVARPPDTQVRGPP